jgi:hypothetical protein
VTPAYGGVTEENTHSIDATGVRSIVPGAATWRVRMTDRSEDVARPESALSSHQICMRGAGCLDCGELPATGDAFERVIASRVVCDAGAASEVYDGA